MSRRIVVQDYEAAVGLPKKTQSLCPDCKKVIEATILEKNGKAVMQKECDEHGKFEDVVWSDAEMYLKMEGMAHDGVGLENPTTAVCAHFIKAIPAWLSLILLTAAILNVRSVLQMQTLQVMCMNPPLTRSCS